jgi:putative flippase GtrA
LKGKGSDGSVAREFQRWLKFNVVGGAGLVIQLTAMFLLTHLTGLNYLVATVLSVEAAVLHNFVWHMRWTWSDRAARLTAGPALLRFNLTNGAISIVGNVLIMRLLVGEFGLRVTVASVGSIALCSALNFTASNLWAFRG